MNAVPALLRALDTLDRVDATLPRRAPTPLVGPYFAARLAALGAEQPPQSQVVVTLGAHSSAPLRATNEETLIASYAAVATRDDSVRRTSALTTLSAAVALRTLAQREPWFVGDPAPSASDIVAEFGVRGVTFSRDVPADWRPLYLRELRDGLRDMQLALPALRFDDLRLHFGAEALPDSALAMHDPRTRTLDLSIMTSGGTLAHELAHDLDWQTARRLFASSGGYSTDRALSERRGPLARSVRGLAEARLLRPMSGVASPPAADRPAELFARGVDWYVATALALDGRSNGFLTAVEDATLLGLRGRRAVGRRVGGRRVARQRVAADDLSPRHDSRRVRVAVGQSERRRSGGGRAAHACRRRFPGVVRGRPRRAPARRHRSRIRCRRSRRARARPATHRKRSLVSVCSCWRSTRALAAWRCAARAIVCADVRPEWANGLLGVAPWSPDDGERVVSALRSAIAADVTTALSDQGVVPFVPAIFRSNSANCSANSR